MNANDAVIVIVNDEASYGENDLVNHFGEYGGDQLEARIDVVNSLPCDPSSSDDDLDFVRSQTNDWETCAVATSGTVASVIGPAVSTTGCFARNSANTAIISALVSVVCHM